MLNHTSSAISTFLRLAILLKFGQVKLADTTAVASPFGTCPPPATATVHSENGTMECLRQCNGDETCDDNLICCPTVCGGTVCRLSLEDREARERGYKDSRNASNRPAQTVCNCRARFTAGGMLCSSSNNGASVSNSIIATNRTESGLDSDMFNLPSGEFSRTDEDFSAQSVAEKVRQLERRVENLEQRG